jgi:hypothetical protein
MLRLFFVSWYISILEISQYQSPPVASSPKALAYLNKISARHREMVADLTGVSVSCDFFFFSAKAK